MSRTFGQFTAQWAAKQSQMELPGIVPAQSPPPAPARPAQPWWSGMVEGEKVECTDSAGVFRKCSCGSTEFIVGPGKGPHLASLRCDGCGRGGRWLGKAYFAEPAT
jgi:hypothetical protein